MELYLPLIIFILTFLGIITEVVDKALLAIIGATLMVVFGVLDFETAIAAIDFGTIILLMSMMILVELAKNSGVFSWLNLKLASFSKGNPLLIFTLFASTTMMCSAFLDNVTTVLIIVPVTVILVKGMGLDARVFVLGEIFFANLGGAMSLIGDPTNIIIGTAADLSFNRFAANLTLPVFLSALLVFLVLLVRKWSMLKPISKDLKKLFLSQFLIEKIKYKFLETNIKKSFAIKTVVVIVLTILAFVLESQIGLPLPVIAISGAATLLLLLKDDIKVHKTLESVEWTTLFFFAGLFIMVAGLEQSGILEKLATAITTLTDNYVYLILLVLWISAFISMILDNIPFVTVMVPVIFVIQGNLAPGLDETLLWWALSLGACLGGNATLVGSSANLVAVGAARKEGVDISFMQHLRFALPFSLLTLVISSLYLIIRAT